PAMVPAAERPYIEGMEAAQRRLEELVLGVLAPAKPAETRDDEVSIEVCDEDDLSTTQFLKYSSPYDKVDIEVLRESTPRLARPIGRVEAAAAKPHERVAVLQPEPRE